MLVIKFGEDSHFDNAGLREDLVFAQIELLAGAEILNRDTHDAIEVTVYVVNLGFQLPPKHFLLGVQSLLIRHSILSRKADGEQYNHGDCSHSEFSLRR